MKKLISFIIILAVTFTSCENVVDGINDNPNAITLEDVEAELFLTGAMLANTVAQGGHLNRIAGMWSGHLTGFASLYSNIYGYDISTAEATATWSRYYVGTIPNVRYIRSIIPNDRLVVGICKVLEAHAIGTAASLFGDVPYREINNPDISDPAFDPQSQVFADAIVLLTEAIADLNAATSRSLPADIYYDGDAAKWSAAASTLQARYYLQLKNYPMALAAAGTGITSDANNMRYIPRGDPAVAEGDKNLFWMILAGSRGGDIGTGNSYLMQLLDPANTAVDRNNAKTNESARFSYYTIDEGNAGANMGIVNQFEPQNLVSFAENQLILAECEARASGVSAAALGYLNSWRQFMATGGHVNANFQDAGTYPRQYDDYVAADFANGGIENADGIADDRAFLREVIEERYSSGMGMYLAFNDVRRLAKDDSDIMVPFPLNPGGTLQPERMPYSDDELNTNRNSPSQDPGIYEVTEVNK